MQLLTCTQPCAGPCVCYCMHACGWAAGSLSFLTEDCLEGEMFNTVLCIGIAFARASGLAQQTCQRSICRAAVLTCTCKGISLASSSIHVFDIHLMVVCEPYLP